MINKFKTDLLNVLTKDTYPQYKLNGVRSTRKLIAIHTFLANFLRDYFSSIPDIEVKFNSGDGLNKEIDVDGAYYPKKIDITVLYNSSPILCLGFKFPCSNYKQNSNNYFENLLGETCNIQQAKIPYFHLLVLPAVMPYKQKDGESNRNEKITEKDMEKYIKLMSNPNVSVPHHMLILLIDFDDTFDNIIGYSNLDNVFQSKKIEYTQFKNKFEQAFTIDHFFDKLNDIREKLKADING